MDDQFCLDCDADLEATGMRHHPTCPLVVKSPMDEREKQIVELAFALLEKTMDGTQFSVWLPPLTKKEVAALRRKLVYRVAEQ